MNWERLGIYIFMLLVGYQILFMDYEQTTNEIFFVEILLANIILQALNIREQLSNLNLTATVRTQGHPDPPEEQD
jgi:hypothetical protein